MSSNWNLISFAVEGILLHIERNVNTYESDTQKDIEPLINDVKKGLNDILFHTIKKEQTKN